MSCLRYLCLLAYCGVQHVLTIRGTWRVFNKRQKLLTLHEFIHGVLVFYGVRVAHLFIDTIFVCIIPDNQAHIYDTPP
jgi:hypothetical protein